MTNRYYIYLLHKCLLLKNNDLAVFRRCDIKYVIDILSHFLFHKRGGSGGVGYIGAVVFAAQMPQYYMCGAAFNKARLLDRTGVV